MYLTDERNRRSLRRFDARTIFDTGDYRKQDGVNSEKHIKRGLLRSSADFNKPLITSVVYCRSDFFTVEVIIFTPLTRHQRQTQKVPEKSKG